MPCQPSCTGSQPIQNQPSFVLACCPLAAAIPGKGLKVKIELGKTWYDMVGYDTVWCGMVWYVATRGKGWTRVKRIKKVCNENKSFQKENINNKIHWNTFNWNSKKVCPVGFEDFSVFVTGSALGPATCWRQTEMLFIKCKILGLWVIHLFASSAQPFHKPS